MHTGIIRKHSISASPPKFHWKFRRTRVYINLVLFYEKLSYSPYISTTMKKGRTKILYIITKSNMGGAQRYVYELATNLPSEKYEVAVAFGGHGDLKDKLENKGIKTYEIKSFERNINIIKEMQSMFELSALMKEFAPDVVHLNSSKAGGSGALVAKLRGVRNIIFTVHGWPFYEKRNIVWRVLAWLFSYLTMLLSNKIIVVSKHDYDKHMMPFQSHKLIHINIAVPNIIFKERNEARTQLFNEEIQMRHDGDIWAVSTGELTQNKNIMRLLSAVKTHNESASQKIFLTIMGEGEEKEKLEQYVHKHNLQNNIVFLGFVDSARIYLKAFDTFVLPSLKEGLPYGLLEAGLAELYCIASRVGGIPEVIKHGVTGFLIDPAKKHDLIMAFKETPSNIENYSKALKKYILSEFSLEVMVQKTQELYSHH